MTKAVLDTTILTNILLKPQAEGKVARQALRNYGQTLLPQYAVKEFKAGPLRNYIWLYNKVLSCDSWIDAVATIPLLFRQANKMQTAMQAMVQFQSSITRNSLLLLPGNTQGRPMIE